MNYQGGASAVAGISTVTAGVAILPNTGETPVLLITGIAAIVTGVTLISLQIGVWAYRRLNK